MRFFLSHTKFSPPLNIHIYIILSLFSHIVASFFRCRNPLSPTFIFLSEGQQPLFPLCVTLSLESASQGTSSAYLWWRLITLIWSHTCQFVISFITTVTIHYSFSLPLPAHNSSFLQILSFIVLPPFQPPDWLHILKLFFSFFLNSPNSPKPSMKQHVGHVGFNFGTAC